MSPDWPELINALASAQRSLASEITCGLTGNSSNLINSLTSQKTKNTSPLSINYHYQRPSFSLSILTLGLQIKSKPHCPWTPILDHTSLIYTILHSHATKMFNSIWNHTL